MTLLYFLQCYVTYSDYPFPLPESLSIRALRHWFLLRIYSLRIPSYPRHRLFPLFLKLPVLVPGDSD